MELLMKTQITIFISLDTSSVISGHVVIILKMFLLIHLYTQRYIYTYHRFLIYQIFYLSTYVFISLNVIIFVIGVRRIDQHLKLIMKF